MKMFGFEKMLMCIIVEGGGGMNKCYVLYTCENVNNFGWPLIQLNKQGQNYVIFIHIFC